MGRFSNIFKRSRKNTQPTPSLTPAATDKKNGTGINIANLPVAGMQRAESSNYLTSYSSNQMSTQPSNTTALSSGSTMSGNTAVDNKFVSKNGESHWKGQPTGRPYDRREELTAEDEDMWARMAM